jgi:hypothetical protein
MDVKLSLAIGTVAAGWMLWSSGYAQAADPAQDLSSSRPLEIAQSSGTGGPMGGGAPGGGAGVGPSGQTSHGVPRTNGMDTMGEGSGHRDMRTPQQGAEEGMRSDLGTGGLPGPASEGSTFGGGGTNSLGRTSVGGSIGMAPSGGTSGMGGSAGRGTSGGASVGGGR